MFAQRSRVVAVTSTLRRQGQMHHVTRSCRLWISVDSPYAAKCEHPNENNNALSSDLIICPDLIFMDLHAQVTEEVPFRTRLPSSSAFGFVENLSPVRRGEDVSTWETTPCDGI